VKVGEVRRRLEKVGYFLGDISEKFRRYLAKVGDEDAVKSTPKTGQDTGLKLTLEMSNSISKLNTKMECKRYWRCVRFCVSGLLVSNDNKVSTIFTPSQNFLY